MYLGNNGTGMTGSLSGNSYAGLVQCLTKLQETFDSEFQLDYARDVVNILSHKNLLESYNNVLLEDYADVKSSNAFEQELQAGNFKQLEEQFEMSRNALLDEATLSGNLKPVVGLTLPLLKVYWIKNVFKDFIPTQVATEQTFKIGLEREYIIDDNRQKHMLPEAFTDPNVDLSALARQKLSTAAITIPQLDVDLITLAGGSRANDDQVSKQFFINTITYNMGGVGDPDVVVKTRVRVDQGTGMFREAVTDANGAIIDILRGDLDFETGKLNVSSDTRKITSVTVDGSLSNENHLRVLSSGWDKEVHEFTIPDGDHLSTGLTEERIKDEKVIYNIDSTAKVIDQMNRILAQLKDSKINTYLDNSKERIRGTKLFKGATFDCKPPSSLTNVTYVDWTRETLKLTLDNLSYTLTQVLQDENVMISVLGNPVDIKLLDNIDWMYGQNTEVGGCKLDYTIGLYNKNRNFVIGSSQKMAKGKIRIIISPLTDEHMCYKLFEYQFFISNEYRDPHNLRIPAVMASDRYLIDELIPIQGELTILNNEISPYDIYNTVTP